MSDALLPMRPRKDMPAELSVVGRTGCSPATIYRMIKAGTFPEPAKIGASSLWSEAEIAAWIDERKGRRHLHAA